MTLIVEIVIKEIDTITSIEADEFSTRFKNEDLKVVDVRKPGEFEAEHVENADNIPLDFINENMARFNNDDTTYITDKQ